MLFIQRLCWAFKLRLLFLINGVIAKIQGPVCEGFTKQGVWSMWRLVKNNLRCDPFKGISARVITIFLQKRLQWLQFSPKRENQIHPYLWRLYMHALNFRRCLANKRYRMVCMSWCLSVFLCCQKSNCKVHIDILILI